MIGRLTLIDGAALDVQLLGRPCCRKAMADEKVEMLIGAELHSSLQFSTATGAQKEAWYHRAMSTQWFGTTDLGEKVVIRTPVLLVALESEPVTVPTLSR